MNEKTLGEMTGPEFKAYAEKLGVTHMRISQARGKITVRMRTPSGDFYGTGSTPLAAIVDVTEQIRWGLS